MPQKDDKFSERPAVEDKNILAMADRRASDRYRSVCRIARVRRASDAGLWLVRNISDKGMMLVANVALNGGEDVEIDLSDSITISGRIVWSDKGRCGVVFSRKIDVAATLAALAAEQRAEGYRALRLQVSAKAILALPSGARPIDLVDISQAGAGFHCETSLNPGSILNIILPGEDHPRCALVRWSRELCGGLWFTTPLERAVLESVARFQLD
ncbi:PilZ domain-containing protein [Sphingopyxis sp.]|uniref:PilZ domain-containing protein n=1 Tax=Sphingopyxis sp. TaxID=1908224 RepID=UPI002B49FFED|nr:PilZ domain-containing protein [Sphingopyxis sp.]HJS09988.1 PilZ domain-containing protein [Sphingopyxis sp.]